MVAFTRIDGNAEACVSTLHEKTVGGGGCGRRRNLWRVCWPYTLSQAHPFYDGQISAGSSNMVPSPNTETYTIQVPAGLTARITVKLDPVYSKDGSDPKSKGYNTGDGATKQLYAVWTRTDSLAACAAPRTAAVLSRAAATDVADGSSSAVPEWAAGTYYGEDEDSFSTVTVSADGDIVGIVLFEDDTWTIAGMTSGFCIEAEVVDEAGNAKAMVFRLSLAEDGCAFIESEDGSTYAARQYCSGK